ncbi:MAG TPA: biopolymer transporter ExbD [Allosphingosinicella sp.]
MAMQMASGEGEPMMDINTTPLIDVMLVLLIMFIITIPIQSHAVKLDLPVNDESNPPLVDPIKNVVYIMPNDAILWNGSPVDRLRLRQYLDLTLTYDPVPELHLQPDPNSRYEVVDEVLAETKRANITKMGFVGNEAYGSW